MVEANKLLFIFCLDAWEQERCSQAHNWSSVSLGAGKQCLVAGGGWFWGRCEGLDSSTALQGTGHKPHSPRLCTSVRPCLWQPHNSISNIKNLFPGMAVSFQHMMLLFSNSPQPLSVDPFSSYNNRPLLCSIRSKGLQTAHSNSKPLSGKPNLKPPLK